jgi:mono/diheme cytochrome c family protein
MSDNAAFSTGKVNGELVTTIPVEVTKEMLLAGQRTFNNFCAMCHGYGGNGDGSVARKGMPAVSLHSPELRAAPVGYFFDVITNGKGKMLHLATQIQPYQRWTVVAYLRALQLSQYAALDKLPADLQAGVAAVDR